MNVWLVLTGLAPHGFSPPGAEVAAYFKPARAGRFSKKAIRGMRACLRAGMQNEDAIKELLIRRRFLVTHDNKTPMDLRGFRLLFRTVQASLCKDTTSKRQRIWAMLKEGHEIAHIAKTVRTTEMYVKQMGRRVRKQKEAVQNARGDHETAQT